MRPPRAQAVVLRLPGRDDVRAYVADADEVRMTLVLAVREQQVLAASGTPAVVEYTNASGVHRLTGVTTEGRHGVVEVDRRPPADEHIQRRQWARADAEVPVHVELRDVDSGRHATVAVNVSGGGALLDDPVGLPIGAVTRLRMQLPRVSIEAEAEVVRETEHGEKGVRIIAISDEDREVIVRFVADRQRAELARRRQATS
jgi:hypothetical protein